MPLPDSYLLKPGSVPAYFDAILNAQAPTRFSQKFLEGIGFKSTNDRLIIGVLKDLKFLDSDGSPSTRYYEFLDRSQAARVLADGIRSAYSELFAVNINADKLATTDVKNKLRTLYAGSKKDDLIGRIARTFTALCEYADFGAAPASTVEKEPAKSETTELPSSVIAQKVERTDQESHNKSKKLSISGITYTINIVLPETRDTAVYDAIFKSLREHL